MIYETTLAVDLCLWTYEVRVEIASEPRGFFTAKIPDHHILIEFATGQKRLHITIGSDRVIVPKDLFQKLLWEISSCQETLRSRDGTAISRLAS